MKKLMLAIIAVSAITMQSHASTDAVKVLRKTIRFQDYRALIIEALKMHPLTKDRSFTLISGFVTESAESESRLETSLSLVVGEHADPMIMLQDSENNTIYVLALKTILPDIEW